MGRFISRMLCGLLCKVCGVNVWRDYRVDCCTECAHCVTKWRIPSLRMSNGSMLYMLGRLLNHKMSALFKVIHFLSMMCFLFFLFSNVRSYFLFVLNAEWKTVCQ